MSRNSTSKCTNSHTHTPENSERRTSFLEAAEYSAANCLSLEGRAGCAQLYSIYTSEMGAGRCSASLPPAGTSLFLNHLGCWLHLAHCVSLKHINSSMRRPRVMSWRKSDDQGSSTAHDRKEQVRGPRKGARKLRCTLVPEL